MHRFSFETCRSKIFPTEDQRMRITWTRKSFSRASTHSSHRIVQMDLRDFSLLRHPMHVFNFLLTFCVGATGTFGSHFSPTSKALVNVGHWYQGERMQGDFAMEEEKDSWIPQIRITPRYWSGVPSFLSLVCTPFKRGPQTSQSRFIFPRDKRRKR